MLCVLWVIFQIWALVVEGGVSSGSAEANANAGANNNGAAAGNNANPGTPNGIPLNGETIMAQLVQLGGSFFIRPLGKQIGQAPVQQLIPVGALQQGGPVLVGHVGGANVYSQAQVPQAAVQQLIPIGALQQGGPLLLGHAGGTNLNPQGQTAQGAMLFALLPQRNAGADAQGALLQLIGQQPPGAAGGRAAGRARFQRSVAAHLRRTQSPQVKVKGGEEEEECSGMEPEQQQQQQQTK